MKRTLTRTNSTDIIGILNKPTTISKQLSMMKILSALVFCLLFKNLYNKTLFKVIIANAVNVWYIC